MTQFRITMTQEERARFEGISKTGKGPARQGLYARSLLLLDRGEFNPKVFTESEVSTAMGLSIRTLQNLKRRFVQDGLDSALGRKQYEVPVHRIKYDGKFEAQVTALACSAAPEGFTRWTIRLLRDKIVELGIAPSVTTTTVFNTLKKTHCVLTKACTGKSRPTTMANS